MAASRRIAPAVALAVALGFGTVALASPERRVASAAYELKNVLVTSVMAPLPDESERGLVQTNLNRNRTSIIAVLVGLAVDPSDPSGNTYRLRVAEETCSELRGDPDSVSFVGRSIFGSEEFFGVGSSAYLDDTDIVQTVQTAFVNQLRKGRSMVLVATGPGGGPHVQACGSYQASRVVTRFDDILRPAAR